MIDGEGDQSKRHEVEDLLRRLEIAKVLVECGYQLKAEKRLNAGQNHTSFLDGRHRQFFDLFGVGARRPVFVLRFGAALSAVVFRKDGRRITVAAKQRTAFVPSPISLSATNVEVPEHYRRPRCVARSNGEA